MRLSLFIAMLFAAGAAFLRAAEPPPIQVGLEGQIEVEISGVEFEPLPADERADMLLRLASVEEAEGGGGFVYDLRYIGSVPGRFDLAQLLQRKDGEPGQPEPIWVEITGLLPPEHDMLLEEQGRSPLSLFGGYRAVMIAVACLWLLAFIPFWLTRKKRAAPAGEIAAPPPTLADRLRPIVQRAARGDLDAGGKAQLERMLLGFWRERLDLGSKPSSEALAAMRAHPEAGAIVRSLEEWLHRPPGSAQVDIDALLQPYAAEPAPGEGAV